MAGSDQRWLPLAAVFPAGLDTETDRTRLRDGFSPDAYGLDLEYPGRLVVASSVPTGADEVTKTFTIGANTWTWLYRRCWRIDGANLHYLAPLYQDIELYQDVPLSFAEDANAILKILPIGQGGLFAGKSTGGYLVPGASNEGGGFRHGDIEEAMKIAAAENVVSKGGVVYASNAYGLMAWNGNDVEELTSLVRSRVAAVVADTELKIDPQKMRVVGTDSFVYDIRRKLFFDYATSGFRYTTRTLTSENGRPFAVHGVAFEVENTDEQRGHINMQVRRDEDWEREVTVNMFWQENDRARSEYMLEGRWAAHKFDMRITEMSTNLRVRKIEVLVDATMEAGGWSQ